MGGRRIVTAANSEYFHALFTLLTTNFHQNDPNLEIDVWDLGLSTHQRSILTSPLRQKVNFHSIRELGIPPFLGAFKVSPKSFAWKPRMIRAALRHATEVLWLDAGVAVVNNLDYFFDSVAREGYCFFRNNEFKNLDYTSRDCARILGATNKMLFSAQIHGNILGFSNRPEALNLVEEWCNYSSIRKAIVSKELLHRHDQSILSLLIARDELFVRDGSGVIAEYHDYQQALIENKLFLAHRRKFNWIDYNSILNL
jgi:hypothetical protein